MVHTVPGKPGNSVPPLENPGILISPGKPRKIVEFNINKNNYRGQDTHKNSGSHVGPSDANFGCPHQILLAHLIVYFSYENLTTHNIQKVLKKNR